MKGKQKKIAKYYDRFAKIYDFISSKSYYRKPREFAVNELNLNKNQTVLNIPCGTGQNFEYFQEYLQNTGKIIGIDLSSGMLEKAKDKIKKNKWNNIQIIKGNATEINAEWIKKEFEADLKFDAIFCDLGLSGFPEWGKVIDNLILLLKPKGKIVIMDWYIEKVNLRGMFIEWIGKGKVNRPIWQYLENKVENFNVNNSFKSGEMFVASGNKKNKPSK